MLNILQLIFLFILWQIADFYEVEKIRYISTERPNLVYWNPKYFTYFNVSCRRYGRKDPIYYFEAHFETKYLCPNNLSVDLYFYQFLSNQYKRSFVEMHFLVCDVLHKDTFFGNVLKQGKLKAGCPIKKDKFDLYNVSIPTQKIPQNFPFTKGRIYLNLTSTEAAKDPVLYGHVDMEIKELKVKRRTRRETNLSVEDIKLAKNFVKNETS